MEPFFFFGIFLGLDERPGVELNCIGGHLGGGCESWSMYTAELEWSQLRGDHTVVFNFFLPFDFPFFLLFLSDLRLSFGFG